MQKREKMIIAIILIIMGICIRLFTLIHFIIFHENGWWVNYLETISTGFGAAGLLIGVVEIISLNNRKGNMILLLHTLLLITPFLLFNLFNGITAYNIIFK